MEVTTIDNWLVDLFQNLGGSGGIYSAAVALVSFVCWTIWKARCEWVFEYAKLELVSVISTAVVACGEFLGSNKKNSGLSDQSQKQIEARERTTPPSYPMIKISTDGTWDIKMKGGRPGSFTSNQKGELFASTHATVPSSSPLIAEALSLSRDGKKIKL